MRSHKGTTKPIRDFRAPDVFIVLKDEAQLHDPKHVSWDVRVNVG